MAATLKREIKNERFLETVEHMDAETLEEGELSDDDGGIAPLAEAEAIFEDAVDGPITVTDKRFCLVGDRSLSVPERDLNRLYSSLGIDKENERHYRFNAIHLRGVGKMRTKDILDYFSGLDPVRVVWLEKGKCNVEWNDEILSARALLYLSVEIIGCQTRLKFYHDSDDSSSDVDDDNDPEISGDAIDASILTFTLPPGRWRKGMHCTMSKRIIMRYANQDDKAVPMLSSATIRERHSKRKKRGRENNEVTTKNPWGPLAQSWGRGEGVEKSIYPNPPSDLRRSLNTVHESRFLDYCLTKVRVNPPLKRHDSSSDSDSRSSDDRRRKLPRMYADREEEKQKISRMESELRPKVEDLRAKLNLRKTLKTKRQILPPPIDSTSLVHSEDSLDDVNIDWASERYQDLRKTLQIQPRETADVSPGEESELDLSDFEPGEMIQIEIDNEYYKKPRKHRH